MIKVEIFYSENDINNIIKQIRAVQIKNPKFHHLTNTLYAIRNQLEAQAKSL